MCLPNAVVLLDAAKPLGLRKNLVFVVFGAVTSGGAVVRAVFGGIISKSWPWAFYSFALVLATAAIASCFVILNPVSGTKADRKLSLR